MKPGRSLFIDASRGLAMLFVCVSHFAISYFDAAHARESRIFSRLALPSTPTFVALSGLLLGFLSVQSPGTFPSLSLKLKDRGLFLLLPVHLLITIAHLAIFGTARFVYITDAVGICILLGPGLVSTFSSAARAALGIGLMALSWYVYLTWAPSAGWGGSLHSIVFGDVPFKNGWLTFPLLPWLASYLLATPLGEKVAEWKRAGSGFVFRLGLVSIGAMAVGLAMHLLGRHQSAGIRAFLSAGQKYPPSPSFVLTSGGAGLGITALIAWIEQRQMLPRVLSTLALLGRTSLVVFVIQYFVYYVGIHSMHLHNSHFWPAYLVGSLALIFGLAFCWDRYLGNDYLTLGLPALLGAPSRAPSPKV